MKQNTSAVVLALLCFIAGCETADSARHKLIAAITQDDMNTAVAMIHKFPDLAKGTDDNGVPLLIVAMDVGYGDMAELLLKNGADPNLGKPIPPLLEALNPTPHPDEVKLLVNYGANVNFTSEALGVTPLMLAANHGDLQSAQALVSKGADVNATDTAGKMTVLHHAVYGANADLVALLLQKGASANKKDDNGQTPLEMAIAASAPQKTDEQFQSEIAELAKTNPNAAAKLGVQRIMQSAAGAPLRGKNLTKVIAALQGANT